MRIRAQVRSRVAAITVVATLLTVGCTGAQTDSSAADDGASTRDVGEDASPPGERDRTDLDEMSETTVDPSEFVEEGEIGVDLDELCAEFPDDPLCPDAETEDDGLVVPGTTGPRAVVFEDDTYLAPPLPDRGVARYNNRGVRLIIDGFGILPVDELDEEVRSGIEQGRSQTMFWFIGQVRNRTGQPIEVPALSATAVIGGEQYEANFLLSTDPSGSNGLRPGAAEDLTIVFESRDPPQRIARAKRATLVIPAVYSSRSFDDITPEIEVQVSW